MELGRKNISDKKGISNLGGQRELIKSIIEDFIPRFISDGVLVYVSDPSMNKDFDESVLQQLELDTEFHDEMPDIVIYSQSKHWIFLVESVTSHGPIDEARQKELQLLFEKSSDSLIYVTAFPNRLLLSEFASIIAWKTVVWIADNPTHLIHFNGERFLGPY